MENSKTNHATCVVHSSEITSEGDMNQTALWKHREENDEAQRRLRIC